MYNQKSSISHIRSLLLVMERTVKCVQQNDGTTLNYVHVDQCVIASRILLYNPFLLLSWIFQTFHI